MHSVEGLKRTLSRIDGRGYKAYKDLEGSYDMGRFSLHVDHVQGDPFAAPSKVRVRVPMKHAALPPFLFSNGVRQMATEDYLARKVQRAIYRVSQRGRGSGKSGLIDIDAGDQEVLERTACKVISDWVEARIYVGLPAAGRRILGREAEKILCDQIPKIAEQGLFRESLSHEQAKAFTDCVENQEFIRGQLDERGLIAFVADGAVLPRESGNSQRPLAQKEAVPFESPDTLFA